MTDGDQLDDARRVLYRTPPEQFLSARAALVDATADADLSKAIHALRKPTVAAWIVNTQVHNDPTTVTRLTGIGDHLRQAHGEGDMTAVRELTLQRRTLVAELARAAVTGSGRASVSQTVRDEVGATFDAAVADPEIAAGLGALQKPESWSGFGLESVSGPGLTLVSGGHPKQAATGKNRQAEPTEELESPPPPAELVAAQDRLAAAEAELSDVEGQEESLTGRIRKLTTRMATLQHELDQARRDLSDAKKAVTDARRGRRTARAALDRIERHS